MHICIISGARPQFIRLSPVIKALRGLNLNVTHIHTGQHYDFEMSDKIFEDLGLDPPEINLQVSSGDMEFKLAIC